MKRTLARVRDLHDRWLSGDTRGYNRHEVASCVYCIADPVDVLIERLKAPAAEPLVLWEEEESQVCPRCGRGGER